MSFDDYTGVSDRPISILHVMEGTFTYGGTPRELLSLVVNRNQGKLRHIFLLFSNTISNLNQEFREAGAVVEEVDRHRNWDARLLWDILKVRRRYQCDIINTHFARADIYGTLAGILARIPVVKSVHGILWNDSRWLQRIDSLLSPLRAYTICNSEATRRAVIRRTGAKNTKTIYVGVPDHAVHLTPEQRVAKRTELEIPPDAFVITHVGGMIELRDQSVILRAVRQCIETGINAYLMLVGDGPLRGRLEAENIELGLSQRTRFLGYRSDVVELYAMSDVYVNMAREEGFGIAVIEAMQAGLPVVLANAGALPELIEDGISGLLVPVGDPDGLAKSLHRVVSDTELARRLGSEAKQRAKGLFSISRFVSNIEKVFIDINVKCKN